MFETNKLENKIRILQIENNLLITRMNGYIYAYGDLKKENEVLKKENEALKSKELNDTEKICDGINSELLNLCTKLSDENMLLIHKQPIIREDKPQPKEEILTESLKRDKYGVVSKFEDSACKLCIYKEYNIENNAVCDDCSDVNDYNEYYSSK